MQPRWQIDDVLSIELPERFARLDESGLTQLRKTSGDRKFRCAATLQRIRLPMAMFVEFLQILSDLIGNAGREQPNIRRWTA